MAFYPSTDSVTVDNGSQSMLAFRKQLKKIDDGLGSKDVQKMCFLCRDFADVPLRDLESFNRGLQLFTMLEKVELLCQDNVDLLLELLETIRRKDLMRKAKQFWPGSSNRQTICNYRKMLLDVADNTTSTELMEMSSLVRDEVSYIDDKADTIQFFVALEKEGFMAVDNVSPILDILENKQNFKKVKKYMDQVQQSAKPDLYHQYPLGQTLPSPQPTHSLNTMGGGYDEGASHPCTEGIELRSPDYFKSTTRQKVEGSGEHIGGLEKGMENLSVHDNPSQDMKRYRADDGDGNLYVKSGKELQDEILAIDRAKQPKTPESYISSQSEVSAIITGGSENLPVKSDRSLAQTASVRDDIDDTVMRQPSRAASYPMNNQTTGICLIINNMDFKNARDNKIRLNDRAGSDKDVEGLLNTFTKFHFTTVVEENLSTNQMHNQLDDIKRMDHSRYDAFVCCVLTHGRIGELAGCDGQYLQIRDMTAMFTPEKCPTLGGKPKVFFIQACQGKQLQNIYQVDTEEDAPAPTGIGEALQETLPKHADFLLGYATVPGYVSYRSRSSGSWYIKALYETLNEYYQSEDLLSILTIVIEKLSNSKAPAKKEDSEKGQVPAPVTTLRKKLYFSRDKI